MCALRARHQQTAGKRRRLALARQRRLSPNRRSIVAVTMLLAVFFDRTATFMPFGELRADDALSMFGIVGSNDSPRATVTVLL